ncbi:MAG: asparaginase [Alteripontixanthobacter sp.]
MTERMIQIFATGGTIAGVAGSAIRRDYRPGQIGIDQFLGDIAKLDLPARLTGRQFANIGSEDMTPAIWAALHRAAMEAMADDSCQGIIVTHGTDTAEETAFLLDQTLPTHKPVVVVGAMRAADAVGSDGLRNFANGVRVASDPEAAGRGTVLVMSDEIHAARDARKARTEGVQAFRGYPRGAIGHVTPGSLEWFGPAWRLGEEARLAFHESMPEVAILHAFAGMGRDTVARALSGGAQGLVLAGFGQGNAPGIIREEMAEAAARGVLVVRSSRVDEGLVDREPEDARHGFIAARALGPAKARILLQLLLANDVRDLGEVQAAFDRR